MENLTSDTLKTDTEENNTQENATKKNATRKTNTQENHGSGNSAEHDLVSVLNEIILMRRQRHQNNSNQDVSATERQKLVESYRNIERLKNTVNGRFFIEYSKGVKTLQQEIV